MDNSCGTPVVSSKWGTATVGRETGGYGNDVDINDGEDLERYGHLQEIDVYTGQWVSQGRLVGLMGSTGRSAGCHMHFEIRWRGWDWGAVNPFEVLP